MSNIGRPIPYPQSHCRCIPVVMYGNGGGPDMYSPHWIEQKIRERTGVTVLISESAEPFTVDVYVPDLEANRAAIEEALQYCMPAAVLCRMHEVIDVTGPAIDVGD